MLVIPRGLIEARAREKDGAAPASAGFSDDPVARREIELATMEAVMAAERTLGSTPSDVSAGNIGYDIASYDPGTRRLRFIEVKGRVGGTDTVMITRQEVIMSLHEPEKFILAVVEVNNGIASEPRYVWRRARRTRAALRPGRDPVQPKATAGAWRGAGMRNPGDDGWVSSGQEVAANATATIVAAG